MKEFIYQNLSLEFLNESIIHIEFSKTGRFCKENTLFCASKEELERSNFEVNETESEFRGYFGNFLLTINKNDLKDIKIFDKNTIVYTYSKILNSGELPSPNKTPLIFPLFDNPRMVLPKAGYDDKELIANNETYVVEEDVDDAYLLLANEDAPLLRKLYVELTGRSELVRFKTLGFWNSRYYKYDEKSAKAMIKAHEEHNIPLDNMVIDTDWRKASDRGIGYDIDTELFPDMKGFFDFAHENDVEIMFNDHPEPIDDAESVFNFKEIAYRKEKLTYLMSLGLDYWWYDRNWSTKLKSPSTHINPETLGDYIFADITKKHYQTVANNKNIYRRPIIMANVDNIVNGSYQKIYNSASHRYSIQWTGDIVCQLDSLKQEVENLIKGCSNEITYINSDIGGHIGNPPKEDYIRWMQLGTFEPIFRVHCTNVVEKYREPWNYDEETLNISRKYINLRYRLLPLLYSKCFDNYLTGEPLFKDISFNYHGKKDSNITDEYLFANDILVSPFSSKTSKFLSKKAYVGKVEAEYFDNTDLIGKPIKKMKYSSLHLSLFHEPPFKDGPIYEFGARFKFKLKFDNVTLLNVVSDDGCTVYVNGKKIHEDKTCHSLMPASLGSFKANEIYDFVIEYYQHGGEAGIYLSTIEKNALEKVVYLPRDEWIDLFNGNTFTKSSKVRKDIAILEEMPLFIRRGSIIPLVKEENRALKLNYSKLYLDYYPSFKNIDKQRLYEDDKESTAYKFGNYRLTNFETGYNKANNEMVVKILKAIGQYEDNITSRDIILKYHLFEDVKDVKEVTINDEVVGFTICEKDNSIMPLSATKNSRCEDTLVIEFKIDLSKDYIIKFKF